ncbi:IclR family transcriptional regulator [Leucobacter sp. UCD-THU]|uniref:IclR family transcriptional regulator n=1 Tax=Leucobacter sp. UCD-THU TaxID=1292023 RepID=UPI00045F6B46|nr:IclR family transcriptional regulator [Leucobacter sp. UCD-THU]EYT56590.1 IclR family transcriptional regulator [Leucobacter sp. UCD-THU]
MFLSLGQKALELSEIRGIARPHLEHLHDLTRDTIHLGTIDDDAVVYLDKIDGLAAVRMRSRIGKRAPIYATGLGKAISAFMPRDELKELLAHTQFEQFTETTLSDLDAFLLDADENRERGWVVDDAEHEAMVHCIAAPIRQADGVVSAISIASPVTPLDELIAYAPQMLAAAEAITRDLGGEPFTDALPT